MDAEKTAQELADEGRLGFRLLADTPMYGSASDAGPPSRVIPKDSLIAVRRDAGPFLWVMTTDDQSGYIRDDTPVTTLVSQPSVAAGVPTPIPPPPPQPVREALAAVPAAQAGAAAFTSAAADDDDFTPVTPPTPEERVLIYNQIDKNKRGTLALIAGFALFGTLFVTALAVVLAAYSGVAVDEDPGLVVRIAIASLLAATAVGIIMYFFSTNTVLAISGGHEVTKAEEPTLYRIVENLSIGSGLPMPKVWVIEDSAPNAFATGRNPQTAHVAATRGLLDKLEKRELEAVMAHEMSHVANYDIRLMTTVAVVVGLIALVADMMLRFTWFGTGGRSSNKDKGGGALGLIILVVALAFILVSPVIASIMRMALSRQREYLADSSGALLCRNPDALADALEKIAADPEPLEAANKATAHLYIENPLKEHASKLNSMFSTHPPVQDRIKILRAMA